MYHVTSTSAIQYSTVSDKFCIGDLNKKILYAHSM